jgi:4-hydroxybenzoate polyprenyltransferase
MKIVSDLPHYLALMRFDKPIGWLLLMWPTLWACWIAGHGSPDGFMIWIFAAGVIVMRSAGCVINDIADRDIDLLVERTQQRPLASGKLSVKQALVLFGLLGILALGLLFMLPSRVWPWSLPALALTITYPFMKRFFQAPQLILGIAFSFGIPMVFVAFEHPFDAVFWVLLISNMAWVIAYDSAYAMSDREDDLKIGVRSSAILFGEKDKLIIGALQCLTIAGLLFIGQSLDLAGSYYVGLVLASALFTYQQWLIRDRDRHACFQAFLNNGWVGGFIWFGLLTAL